MASLITVVLDLKHKIGISANFLPQTSGLALSVNLATEKH